MESPTTPEKDIIYRIVAQYGNAMCGIEEMEQWLIDYAKPKWISVKDKLPKCEEQHNRTFSSGVVLVHTDEGCQLDEYLTYYEDSSFGLKKLNERWANGELDITHWMPLPAPPKQ